MATATKPQAKPKSKGQRPHCLHCGKELLPQFREMIPGMHNVPGKALWGEKLDKWKAENPGWHQWTEHYGRYNDDRFCGLNCGYSYAVAHTKAQKG